MPITLDGTNGISTPLDVEILGSTSGSIMLMAPAVAGSNTQTLVAATDTLAPIIRGTAVTLTTQTSVDFNIPSWVKRITVLFSGVSVSATSNVLYVQLGDSGGIENTGYTAGYTAFSASAITSGVETTGFRLALGATAAAATCSGSFVVMNVTGNLWVGTGSINRTDSGAGGICGGNKTLSDPLTQIRIIPSVGGETFDAGTINVLWE